MIAIISSSSTLIASTSRCERAHALHQRDGIEMPRDVASRRDRDGNRREQNRDQRRRD